MDQWLETKQLPVHFVSAAGVVLSVEKKIVRHIKTGLYGDDSGEYMLGYSAHPRALLRWTNCILLLCSCQEIIHSKNRR